MSSHPYRLTVIHDFSTNKSIEEYHLKSYMDYRGEVPPKLEDGILTLNNHTAVIMDNFPFECGGKYRIGLKNASGDVLFSQNNNEYFGRFSNLENEDVNVEWEIKPNFYSDTKELYIHSMSTLRFSGYEIEELCLPD